MGKCVHGVYLTENCMLCRTEDNLLHGGPAWENSKALDPPEFRGMVLDVYRRPFGFRFAVPLVDYELVAIVGDEKTALRLCGSGSYVWEHRWHRTT